MDKILKIIEEVTMKKCRYCGKELDSNLEFCSSECENSYRMQFTALSGRHSILERPLSGAKRPPHLTDCCKLSRVYLNGVMLGRSFHDGIS